MIEDFLKKQGEINDGRIIQVIDKYVLPYRYSKEVEEDIQSLAKYHKGEALKRERGILKSLKSFESKLKRITRKELGREYEVIFDPVLARETRKSLLKEGKELHSSFKELSKEEAKEVLEKEFGEKKPLESQETMLAKVFGDEENKDEKEIEEDREYDIDDIFEDKKEKKFAVDLEQGIDLDSVENNKDEREKKRLAREERRRKREAREAKEKASESPKQEEKPAFGGSSLSKVIKIKSKGDQVRFRFGINDDLYSEIKILLNKNNFENFKQETSLYSGREFFVDTKGGKLKELSLINERTLIRKNVSENRWILDVLYLISVKEFIHFRSNHYKFEPEIKNHFFGSNPLPKYSSLDKREGITSVLGKYKLSKNYKTVLKIIKRTGESIDKFYGYTPDLKTPMIDENISYIKSVLTKSATKENERIHDLIKDMMVETGNDVDHKEIVTLFNNIAKIISVEVSRSYQYVLKMEPEKKPEPEIRERNKK